MTLDPQTLHRIRRIELKTRRLVNNIFAGAYHSSFKGKGIIIDSVRPYQPGDDVRDIDWNVTARTNEAFIKNYREERELTVMLLVDNSASNLFGTIQNQKYDAATEFAAILALSAITNNDKVGLLIFSDKVEHYAAPHKGRNHGLRIIRDLLIERRSGTGTDLPLAIQSTIHLLKQKSIIFIMSDFLSPVGSYIKDLLAISKKHDVVAVILSDPREHQWQDSGLIKLRDAETSTTKWIDTQSKPWREQFKEQANRFAQSRNSAFLRAGIDRINLGVDTDHVNELVLFFRKRSNTRR